MLYATLTDLREYLGLAATETADDALLARLLEQVSRNIESHCGRRFDARQETRVFDYPLPPASRYRFGSYSADDFVSAMSASADMNAGRLRMDDDLLSATTITNGDGATVSSGDYVLEPANMTPSSAIRIKSGSSERWLPGSDGSREQVISVAGVWGYHLDYSRAWVNTGDTVQDNPLTASATSLTVADADGVAADGRTRFLTGNLIAINGEYLEVTAVDTNTNTLTVWRGVNGSNAVEHAAGSAITVYRPMADIERAALRWCKYIYRQKDADTSDTAHILGTGIAIRPSAMPPDVMKLLPSPRRGVTGQEGLL
jgi:hypothetical protein